MLKKITLKALSNLYWNDVSGGCKDCISSEYKLADYTIDVWPKPEPKPDWQNPKPDTLYINPINPYTPYPYIK